MKRATGFTLIDLMVIAGVLAVLPGCLWAPLSRAREAARRAACLNNLKEIIEGIKTYLPFYGECYPTSAKPGQAINVTGHYRDLGILYSTYVVSLDVFTCPSTDDVMPRVRKDNTYDNKPFQENEAKQVSYAYSYDGRSGTSRAWTTHAPSTTRILADRHASKELTTRSNHRMDGRNAAFADGHVRWISGPARLSTDPDPDTRINTHCWWSERPD